MADLRVSAQPPAVIPARPVPAARVQAAIAVTAQFAEQHGAPVHAGDPAQLGIADLQAPDYGEPVSVGPDEVPLYWACGVTSQVALEHAKLPFFVAHAPGSMLITDLRHAALAAE